MPVGLSQITRSPLTSERLVGLFGHPWGQEPDKIGLRRETGGKEYKQLYRQLFGEFGCDREVRHKGQPEVAVGSRRVFFLF